MAEPSGGDRDGLISQFCAVTGIAPSEAENYLGVSNWDVEAAVSTYYASQEDAENETMAEADAPEPTYTGPRTLGGAPAPAQPGSGSGSGTSTPSSRGPRGPRGVAGARTLRDLQGESSAPTRPSRDHDDDDDEDQDFFAGGEKSGLAVQNPNSGNNPRDHIENILERARRNAPRPGGDDEEEEPRTRFTGAGQTLGGDDAPSRSIPDPNASVPQRLERAHRVMHLWRDGFSIDDGELYRYDDPANAGLLEMINSGRAPLHILNVQHQQEVDLEVNPHRDEDYVPPKRKYKPFSGSGQRLGSPTPGASGIAAAPAAASSSTSASASASATEAPKVQVDDSQPTLTLQIRLGDGTRLQSRFNTTHTIGDVYGFVNASSPASLQREYVLMTTFPNKDHTDKAQVLGEMAEFKKGGVVVQKWK